MGRISRKQKNVSMSAVDPLQLVSAEPDRIPTALYARLSVEQDDDDTIQNQIAYLTEYVNQHDELEIYNIYSDNGYSGTTFDRPAFQQMMIDVQTGQVKCILIKDFSRFGRNFVETGYYIETLLPKLNVRLISINDRFDSIRESSRYDIAVPVKNMVNDLYAKDISKKICVSNEARRKSGHYTVEKAIYGYDKDKENNRLVVNPETAPVVQLIFRWFLEGLKTSEIARRLNAFGISTPKEYKYEKEFNMPLEKNEYWDSGKVRAILLNDAYAGDRCLGMRRNRLYKNQHKQEWLPKEEWTIYRNDHEPLVTREDLEEAQRIITGERAAHREARKRNSAMDPYREGMFSSIIRCKKCGIIMHRENLKYPDGILKPEGGNYACRGRSQIESRRGCGLIVSEGYLQAVVAGQIQHLIRTVIYKDSIVNSVTKNAKKNDPRMKLRNKISNLSWQEAQCDKKLMQLYTDFSSGVVLKDDYLELRSQYQSERNDLNRQIAELREQLKSAEDSARKIRDLAVNLEPHLDNLKLTKELVDYLIERIEIDEERNVEIIFKCRDVFEDVINNSKEGDDP